MKASSSAAEPNSSSLLLSRVCAQRAEVLDRLLELRALAAEVLGRRLEEVGQRAVLVGAGGAEGDGQLVEAGVDLVELERDRGLLLVQDGVVGHHVAARVGRGQLDVAVADDRRGDDHGLGVGRDLRPRRRSVIVDLDPGALGLDRVDRADRDAEDPDVAALVDRDGAREVGRHASSASVPPVEAPERRDQQRDDAGDDDGASQGHQLHLRAARSETAARSGHRRQVRDVGVEPRPGAERVGEHPVERRHQPDAVVDVVLVLVEHADDVLEVVEGRLEVGPALGDQGGELLGQRGRSRPAGCGSPRAAPPGPGTGRRSRASAR